MSSKSELRVGGPRSSRLSSVETRWRWSCEARSQKDTTNLCLELSVAVAMSESFGCTEHEGPNQRDVVSHRHARVVGVSRVHTIGTCTNGRPRRIGSVSSGWIAMGVTMATPLSEHPRDLTVVVRQHRQAAGARRQTHERPRTRRRRRTSGARREGGNSPRADRRDRVWLTPHAGFSRTRRRPPLGVRIGRRRQPPLG